MQKKILIATGIFPPDIGGPATYSKLLADKLPERGFSAKVVSFGEVRHLSKIIRHTAYFFKVLFRARGCGIIYAQDPVSVGLPACLASAILRKSFYLKIVGDYAWEQGVQRFGVTDLLDEFSARDTYSFQVRVMKYIQTMVARHAKRIIVPSKYLKRIVMNWGITGDKISVIYNAFEPLENLATREELRKKLGLSGKVISSVGRLVPWKGFEGLIAVFSELKKTSPGLRLVIVGEGPDRNTLEKLAQKFGVSDSVFFTGRLPQHEMLEYVKASDVFVLNTSYEGFSHQLLEVLAVGTPCATTSVGGNIEIIRDRENGLLFPYNDLPKLKKSIELILTDKALAEKISIEGKKTILSYNSDHMISELTKEFNFSKKPS